MAKRSDVHAASEDIAVASELSASPQELVSALREQVESFLDYATDAALQPLLGSDLPFVGDALGDLVGDTLLAPLRAAIGDALDGIDTAAGNIPKAIAKAINAAEIPGVSAKVVDGNVSIAIQASDTTSMASGKADIDIGYDALGFELRGGLDADLGYKLDAELMFNVDSGKLSVVDKAGDVIELSLEGWLDKLNGEGSLGFLSVDVEDVRDGPEIKLIAGVDIDAGRVNQLDAGDLHTLVNGFAKADFALAASLDGVAPGEPSALPRIFTELEARYQIKNYDPTGGSDGLGATPSIALRDIQLDVGTLVEWLGNVLEPVSEQIFGAYALDELLGTLTAPIPLIDGGVKAIGLFDLFNLIEDNRINLLDLAAAGAPEARPVIEALSKAYNLIKGLGALEDGLGGGERINFGDKVLLGDAPAGTNALAAQDYLDKLRDVLSGIDTPGTGGLDNGDGSLADILDGTGFEIPLLENPEAIVGILLNGLGGDPIDLVRYDVPELSFETGFSQFFPIVGPIGVGLDGQFGAGIDIKVGYDTSGLQSGSLEDGFFITTDPVKGHYVAGPGSSKVFYESAGWVEAGIGASAGINIGIAEVSVGGGVFAGLDTYFEGATTKGDGKLRLSDLSGCMFDPIVGEFGVKVQVKFSIGIGPFSYTKRFDIVKETLANFEFGCTPETEAEHGLASYFSPMQRLTLNAGERADQRIIQGKVVEDGDETYVLKQAANGAIKVQAFKIAEINGHPAGAETADDAGKVSLIVAHMGEGDDQVAIDKDVTAAAQLWGDEGNDLLQGGAAGDLLRGGDEDDRLIGLGGVDDLQGGDGDDVLEGGAGGDRIDGGDGFDQVTYENSKVGVTFRRSATDDAVFVGSGGEAAGDRVTNVEHVIGSHFDDKLYGNPDEGSTLEGLDGDDVLVGGDEEDLLLGGGGADNIDGRDGDDTMSFLTSAGQVVVNLQTGEGRYGDAEGDRYTSVENVHGTAYDDMITGNAEDNKISGWFGDDTIHGGGGADEIDGGEGDDIVFGSADGGTLSGGGWLNAAGKDTLSYLMVGHAVEADLLENDGDDDIARAVLLEFNGQTFVDPNYSTFENLVGSRFDDTLGGDWQANRISGGAGADVIDGSRGDDVLVGGQGADHLTGGDGRDLADYSASSAGVMAFLTGAFGIGGDAHGDTLVEVEDLLGTRFVDSLVGNDGDNRLDPGLSSSFDGADTVIGGGGTDTLVLNYAARDTGRGMTGGYDAGSATKGTFVRTETDDVTTLDRVNFDGIERLEVVGTTRADLIYAGAGNDIVDTGDGNDAIYTGTGFDRIDAGAGNDRVAIGTDANRQLSAVATASFGDIRGGAGIDTYSLSLADASQNIVLTGLNGKTAFNGINWSNGTGAAISGFELLGAISTGGGDDRLTQLGSFDNVFDTGFGADVIAAGQGNDFVYGGQDFRLSSEVTLGETANGRTQLIPVGDITKLFASNGDLMRIDYRGATQAMTSNVNTSDTGYYVDRDGVSLNITTTSGIYSAGAIGKVNFHGIERVEIEGTRFGDRIIGTDLTYGANVANGTKRPVASLSARGDDVLNGHNGHDTIIGGTGDDRIDGGAGNDLIFGTAAVLGRARPTQDLGELDQLTGGSGRDTFVLGNSAHSYYNDMGDLSAGHTARSSANRAVITDFDTGQDKLVLSSQHADVPADLYTVVEKNGDTFIYLKDGLGEGGNPRPAANELIAELKGVTGFDLNAQYVVYDATAIAGWKYGDGSAAPSPYPAGAPAPAAPQSAEALPDTPADALAALMEAAVTAPLEAPKPSWIKQTSDLETLDEALWGGTDAPFTSYDFSIEGNGASFATFKGDPFGLGEGVLISTGRAADLAGRNLVDGGRVAERTVDLVFEDLGTINPTGPNGTGTARIFRADLSQLGFDINSLRLGDSGSGFGGSSGLASGFDIDAVVLSRTKIDDFTSVDQFNGFDRLNAFSFNVADTTFRPGTMRPGNVPSTELTGTINGLPDFGTATLGLLDGPNGIDKPGMLTLGDGGSLGLNLKNEVSTEGPLYLYIAEAGANNETITTGFTASASRLDTPADLSTDLGARGGDDDTAALVYRFNGRQDDTTTTKVAFDFVFFSEEFAEFAQSEFNDKFRITLNGVNLTRTSTGAFGSVSTIYTPPAGPEAQSSIYGFYNKPLGSDYVANPAGTGPLADTIRADGYTKMITFEGDIRPGEENVLRIEVMDTGDGLLDSGLLVSGKMITDTEGSFVIDRDGGALREGQWREVDYRIDLPEDAVLDGPVSVTFRPEAHVDLGAGAGVAVTETLTPDDLTGVISVRVIDDGQPNTSRTDLVRIELGGAMAGEAVPPLALEVIDRHGPVDMGGFQALDPAVFVTGSTVEAGSLLAFTTPSALIGGWDLM